MRPKPWFLKGARYEWNSLVSVVVSPIAYTVAMIGRQYLLCRQWCSHVLFSHIQLIAIKPKLEGKKVWFLCVQ